MAYYKQDTYIHHEWLIVLCTSLINHTTFDVSNHTIINWPVRIIDIAMCHFNSGHCIYRLIKAPKTDLNKQIALVNILMAIYVSYIYHGGKSQHSKLLHASMHVVSTTIVLNTMCLEYES